jgi:hypothetical protein
MLVQLLLAASAHSPATQSVLIANTSDPLVTNTTIAATSESAAKPENETKPEEEAMAKVIGELPKIGVAPEGVASTEVATKPENATKPEAAGAKVKQPAAAASSVHSWILGNATFPHRAADAIAPGRQDLNISMAADGLRDSSFHESLHDGAVPVSNGAPINPVPPSQSNESAAIVKEGTLNSSTDSTLNHSTDSPDVNVGFARHAGSKACFSRETLACKVAGSTSPAEAYAQCFGTSLPTAASLEPMHVLLAGDRVLSLGANGEYSIERVVVNQHRLANTEAPLVSISHGEGALTITADHALWVDGRFVRADAATVGSTLRAGQGNVAVERVSQVASGRVVNPVTSSGTVLAADARGGGVPVLASTHPEHLVKHMLSSAVPFPCSFFNLCSVLFPRTFQECYEAVVEPLADAHADAIGAAVGPHVPSVLRVVAFVLADVAFAAAFVAFASPTLVTAALVAWGLRKRRSSCK